MAVLKLTQLITIYWQYGMLITEQEQEVITQVLQPGGRLFQIIRDLIIGRQLIEGGKATHH